MSTIQIHYNELRDALEASLRAAEAHERAKEICDFDRCAGGAVPETNAISAAEWETTKATALALLDEMISSHLGEARWTVLLAGHLIHSTGDRLPIIIPIEKVTYLDNLRRFP